MDREADLYIHTLIQHLPMQLLVITEHSELMTKEQGTAAFHHDREAGPRTSSSCT